MIGYFLAADHTLVDAGGVAPYSFRILDQLLRAGSRRDLCLLATRYQVASLREWLAKNEFSVAKILVVPERRFALKVNRALSRIAMRMGIDLPRERLAVLNPLNQQMLKAGVGLIHFPMQHLPSFGWNIPVVSTVHDFQEMHFPEFFGPKTRASRNWLNRESMHAATRIVVSYEHIRADIKRFYPEHIDKVHVCPIPVDESWLGQNGIDGSLNIDWTEPFLFYPAQTWQHKNHVGLIRAMTALKESGFPVPLVVCSGRLNDYYPTILGHVKAAGLEDRMKFLGVVSEPDLIRLYKRCWMVIVPTMYEAGSFPLMEAMLLRVPVICSNVTSLPETIGNREFCFDPFDVNDIARILKLSMSDLGFMDRCKQNVDVQRKSLLDLKNKTDNAFRALYASLAR